MKKRFAILSVLLVLLLAASGCLRMRVTFELQKNGTFDFEMLYAMSALGLQFGGEMPFDEATLNQYAKDGFKTETYSEDDYTGIILSKKGIDFSSASDLPDMDLNFTLEKNGDTYTLDLPWGGENMGDIGSGYADSLLSVAEYIEQYEGFAEIVIVCPEKPTEHNATSVSADGKTLTWNLLDMGDRTSIHVVYSVKSSILPGNPSTPAGERTWIKTACLGAGFVLAGVLVFLVIRKAVKNKKESEDIGL